MFSRDRLAQIRRRNYRGGVKLAERMFFREFFIDGVSLPPKALAGYRGLFPVSWSSSGWCDKGGETDQMEAGTHVDSDVGQAAGDPDGEGLNPNKPLFIHLLTIITSPLRFPSPTGHKPGTLRIMTGLKRTVSRRSTRLKARTSPYSASVTLFEADVDVVPSGSESVKKEPEHVETVYSSAETEHIASASTPRKKENLKSPRKPKPIPQYLAIPHPAPPGWQETYDTIRQMRSRITAPVDTMGCEQAQWKESDPKVCVTYATLWLSSFSLSLAEPSVGYAHFAHVIFTNQR